MNTQKKNQVFQKASAKILKKKDKEES